MEQLFKTIKERRRPEGIAQMILYIQGDRLSSKEMKKLDKPTPELVHGVTVSNHFLASVLKSEGYHSGKSKY